MVRFVLFLFSCSIFFPLCVFFFALPSAYATISALMTTNQLRKVLLAILMPGVLVAVAYSVYENREWKIPEEAKRMQNPLQASPGALAAAHAIYSDKCANCHGETGKGDGPDASSYYPAPTNLTDTSHMNSVTDGEIFYQISQGRKPMPSFRKKLSDEQRWQLVLLVRTFVSKTESAAPARAPH
jgi:mono/diheme cytochrome c family protein